MTTAEFEQIVKDWIATAKHPKTGQLFPDMIYQPMLEVLSYLRANGFKNFIVSGGGIEFMRPWADEAYGIPPEQVVGSSIKTKFEMRDGKPVLVRLPALNFNDDKADKPVGINQHIGRRPIAAFGNSRRRPGDAGIHARRRRRAVRTAGAARRCGARICLRSRAGIAGTKTGGFHAGTLRPGKEERLDRRQHEERLEPGVPVRAEPGHGHRHPARAGRHHAPACRSR